MCVCLWCCNTESCELLVVRMRVWMVFYERLFLCVRGLVEKRREKDQEVLLCFVGTCVGRGKIEVGCDEFVVMRKKCVCVYV